MPVVRRFLWLFAEVSVLASKQALIVVSPETVVGGTAQDSLATGAQSPEHVE
jgi:hypothetical protein